MTMLEGPKGHDEAVAELAGELEARGCPDCVAAGGVCDYHAVWSEAWDATIDELAGVVEADPDVFLMAELPDDAWVVA